MSPPVDAVIACVPPVRTPLEAAVGLLDGTMTTSDLPDVAAAWLVAGYDGDALRELAGHPASDAWGIDALWADARQELAVDLPDDEASRIVVAARWELALWSAGSRDDRAVGLVLLGLWTDSRHRADLPGIGDVMDVEDSGDLSWDRRHGCCLGAAALRTMREALGPRR